MPVVAMNYHDHLIEYVQLGPRRELRFSLRTPMNLPCGELRFSAIQNFAAVEDWFKSNGEWLEAANAGRLLLLIDGIEERAVGSNNWEHKIAVDHLESLKFESRRAVLKLNDATKLP